MAEDKKTTQLPKHLEPLFAHQEDDRARAQVLETLSGREPLDLKTGRLSRAFSLGRLAVGGSRRWLSQKAHSALLSAPANTDQTRQQGLDAAAEMLKVFTQMRGAAMKLGQMLSYIDDALPPEARKVLAALQRDATPMSWHDVCQQIQTEFGAGPETLFARFDHTPMAAASIGQVHRATLPTGENVAVKIQYPGIEDAMRADLKNSRIFGLFQQLLGFRTDAKSIAQELEERLLDECDYRKEAAYQRMFINRFRGHPTIEIPDVHSEFSGQRVLTTTFHEGLGFYEWLASDPSPEARDRATRALYRFYLGSFYLDGWFNCDPHPGNYVFRMDGKITFLDFGCTRIFDEERRRLWIELNIAVGEDNRQELERLAVDIGFFKPGWEYDWTAYRDLMRYLYDPYLRDEPFDFSAQMPENTFRTMFLDNPNLKKMNMPADAVFLNRIGFGLVSILTEMGAHLNVRRHSRAYFARQDPDWPEDPHLKDHPKVSPVEG